MREIWWPLISQARWFGGKGLPAELAALTPLPWFVTPESGIGVRSEIATVNYADGRVEYYQLLVAYTAETSGALGVVADPAHGRLGFFDAAGHPAAMRALLTSLVAGHPAIDWADADSVNPAAATSVWAGEQSNTTICVGTDVLFKLFRRLEAGRNLDVEVLTALNGSGDTPALFGTIVGALPDGSQADLGMFVERMAGVSDGWQWACAACAEGRDIRAEAAQLGATLREVHALLANAFGTTTVVGGEVGAQMSTRLDAAIAQASELEPYRESLRLAFSATAGRLLATQRVHGDFHLGQVLRSADGWTIIDFEGEPLKSLDERRRPDSVWRDVAGMVRSFDYVRGAHPEPESDEARAWAAAATAAFLEGYAGGAQEPVADADLLGAYVADKAIYEVVYEVRNRPNWAHIPLAAVHDEARRAALGQPARSTKEI